MQRFAHDGVDIAFLDEGEGEPIVLVHGFASTADVNWVHPGWVATLTRAGRRATCTIRPPITARSWPTTCARCSIISVSSVPM
jgi:pimeloyl-ACP methyl ester carboxylesterase